MRIWYLNPRFYDKKGILAQWNEGIILKNIIINNTKKGGWVNHPFSKRVTRYKKRQQRKIINTYLNNIREYGVKHYKIKFQEKYIEQEYIDNNLRVPILPEQVEKDYEDALTKMEKRDMKIYDSIKDIEFKSDINNLTVMAPFYIEQDVNVYKAKLSAKYKKDCDECVYKLAGTEIDTSLVDKWEEKRKK